MAAAAECHGQVVDKVPGMQDGLGVAAEKKCLQKEVWIQNHIGKKENVQLGGGTSCSSLEPERSE